MSTIHYLASWHIGIVLTKRLMLALLGYHFVLGVLDKATHLVLGYKCLAIVIVHNIKIITHDN